MVLIKWLAAAALFVVLPLELWSMHMSPEQQLLEAAQEGDLTTVTQLIKSGVDCNTRGQDGTTPLIMAAFYNHPEILKELIGAGAHIHSLDDKRNSALTWAIIKEHKRIIKLLMVANGTLKPDQVYTVHAKNKARNTVKAQQEFVSAAQEGHSAAPDTCVAELDTPVTHRLTNAHKLAQLQHQIDKIAIINRLAGTKDFDVVGYETYLEQLELPQCALLRKELERRAPEKSADAVRHFIATQLPTRTNSMQLLALSLLRTDNDDQLFDKNFCERAWYLKKLVENTPYAHQKLPDNISDEELKMLGEYAEKQEPKVALKLLDFVFTVLPKLDAEGRILFFAALMVNDQLQINDALTVLTESVKLIK